jgi:flagellar basal body-associated protein FliL
MSDAQEDECTCEGTLTLTLTLILILTLTLTLTREGGAKKVILVVAAFCLLVAGLGAAEWHIYNTSQGFTSKGEQLHRVELVYTYF